MKSLDNPFVSTTFYNLINCLLFSSFIYLFFFEIGIPDVQKRKRIEKQKRRNLHVTIRIDREVWLLLHKDKISLWKKVWLVKGEFEKSLMAGCDFSFLFLIREKRERLENSSTGRKPKLIVTVDTLTEFILLCYRTTGILVDVSWFSYLTY